MVWKDLEPYDNPEENIRSTAVRSISEAYRHPRGPAGIASLDSRTLWCSMIRAKGSSPSLVISVSNHHTAVIVNRNANAHNVTINFGPNDRDVKLTNSLDGSAVQPVAKDSDRGDDARPTISGGADGVCESRDGEAHASDRGARRFFRAIGNNPYAAWHFGRFRRDAETRGKLAAGDCHRAMVIVWAFTAVVLTRAVSSLACRIAS